MPRQIYCVVGSGPAGVACSQALLQEGAEVIMLDVGIECENDKLSIVRNLAAQEPEHWEPNTVRSIQSDYFKSRGGYAFKPAYGSEFPYAKNELAHIDQDGTKCLVSHAKGGFSNVWGAAVLPAPAEDFRDWPFGLEDLKSSYTAVAKTLGIAGKEDDLARMLPFYDAPHAPAKSSRQARMLLRRWHKNRENLQSSGIIFGRSRLAIKTRGDSDGHCCRLTGLCLTGCPYSAIYNSQQTLEELSKNPQFRYEPGWIAENIGETNDGVSIQCRSNMAKSTASFKAQRAFVACGAIGTAKLILASLDVGGASSVCLPLRYQPYFYLPLLAFFRFPMTGQEKLHTLAQAFMEISDRKISNNPIHLQFYTYNSFIKDKVSDVLKFVPPAMLRRLGPALWERLLVIQGYFNSQDAEAIALRAERSNNGLKISLSGRLSSLTKWKMVRTAVKLARRAKQIGGLPLLPFLELGMPGIGNHIGSIFPMSNKPSGFQSDIWGRAMGFKRTHIVDASVLPTLPATTITYTVMANADRIARGVARQDAGC